MYLHIHFAGDFSAILKEDFNCTEYCDITTLQFLTILFKGTDSN